MAVWQYEYRMSRSYIIDSRYPWLNHIVYVSIDEDIIAVILNRYRPRIAFVFQTAVWFNFAFYSKQWKKLQSQTLLPYATRTVS